MTFNRSAGLLLHPSSLPGFGGIGTIGPAACAFVDAAAAAGIGLWQVLPLGPTGYGDSPYSALSAFAGNPFLVALEPLIETGLLQSGDASELDGLPETHVDFGRIVPSKMTVLRKAFDRFRDRPQTSEYHKFLESTFHWLEDFVLYMAIKDAHDGAPWYEWELPIRRRSDDAVPESRRALAGDLEFHRFVQFQFFSQWKALKEYANQRDIRIVGDIPIFVAHDSADVWANQHLFRLDEAGNPLVVAGVPPDYFSPTGQLWGNPHYQWDVMESDGFRWWILRFRELLRLVDIVRLDHFRGFAGAWEVPFGESTAVHGKWVAGPGAALFSAVETALGDLPIIAEDLGVITPDVEMLRDQFRFPGMHIMQFAFGTDASNPSLPHNLPRNSVVYSGTHDNDTTVGWYASLEDDERRGVATYFGTTGIDVSWDMIRAAFASVSVMAIVPLQDVLRLGTAARMNLPGRPAGNWAWRYTAGSITEEHIRNLSVLSGLFARAPERNETASAV